MRFGVNLQLTIWDSGQDDYDHNQLAANWDAVDQHDHSPGKGKQIGSDGIADAAILNRHLAVNAVTSNKIQDLTIVGGDIADFTITKNKLDPSIFQDVPPLGTVTAWWRPDTNTAVPTGWVICHGQTVTSANHSWSGAGTIQVPDLRNRFVLGAYTSGTGTGTGTAPAESNGSTAVYGGSHTRNLFHSHDTDPHHHSITPNAQYSYLDGDGNPSSLVSHDVLVPDTGYVNVTGIKLETSLKVGGTMPAHGDQAVPVPHDHTGQTGNTNDTVDAATLNSDYRPAFVGLLYIMKVKT
jgi:hypothetical protein